MPGNQINPEKAQKTAVLVGLANLVLSPLYILDARLGLTASIAATAALLYKFNKIGQQRRPGGNWENRVNNFFGPYTGDTNTDLLNTARNIVNGGDVVFDQTFSGPR